MKDLKTPRRLAKSLRLKSMGDDPYAIWAAATGFRDYVRAGSRVRIAVAIECFESVNEFVARARKFRWIRIPTIYKRKSGVDLYKTHYCSVRIPPHRYAELLPLVKRAELGSAVTPQPVPRLSHRSKSLATGGNKQTTTKVVIGIIDDFVAFDHPAFADAAGASRVRCVWSQGPDAPQCADPDLWQDASGSAGYGFELSCLRSPAGLHAAYPKTLGRFTHGTAIADLATRLSRPVAGASNEVPDIVAVHMPERVLDDASGGALNVQVLDGLHYILHRAASAEHVVVNLSYATMAGPHDGSTILERAIDELAGVSAAKLSVVLPAGNAYESQCHARFDLNAERLSQVLRWKIIPDDLTPSFLEIWLPAGAANQVKVTVTNPIGRKVSLQPGLGGQEFDSQSNSGKVSFGVIRRTSVHSSGTFILVAVAATDAKQPGRVVAPHGEWLIELSHDGSQCMPDICAWIERDDSAHGQQRGGRQSYFVDDQYQLAGESWEPPQDTADAYVKRNGSFNTIATGNSTYVAGGYVGGTTRVAAYSGGGPTRSPGRSGPLALEVSEESLTEPGLLVAAVSPADSIRINGTSVAAPQFTARMADLAVSGAPLGPASALQQQADSREGRGRLFRDPRQRARNLPFGTAE